MQQEERKILKQYDTNGDGTLDVGERAAARKVLAEEAASGGGPRRPGRFGPRGGEGATPRPGPKVAKADVKPAGSADLFDIGVVRTLFLDFDARVGALEVETGRDFLGGVFHCVTHFDLIGFANGVKRWHVTVSANER